MKYCKCTASEIKLFHATKAETNTLISILQCYGNLMNSLLREGEGPESGWRGAGEGLERGWRGAGMGPERGSKGAGTP